MHEKAIKFLTQGRYLEADVKFAEEQLENLYTIATKCTGSLNPTAGVSSSKEDHSNEQIMIEIVSQKEKIEKLKSDYIQGMNEVTALIESIRSPLHRRLLNYRYITGLKWPEIEDKLCYSHSHTMNLHRQALQMVENMLAA